MSSSSFPSSNNWYKGASEWWRRWLDWCGKTWLGESRVTCIAHWVPSSITTSELYLTTLVVKLTAICDQMSLSYKANKSADKESQFSELRRSQRKKKIDKNLSDSFIIQTTYSKRLKSCIPIPKVLEELKLGCDPLLAAKKSDLWLYLTGLLQQFIKTNKSNFNCKEQCSFCTFFSTYQSSFFHFQFWP